MKKLLSLLLALIMLISLALPAFAIYSYHYDEKTGEHYEEFWFDVTSGPTFPGNNISITSNKYGGEVYAGGDKYTKIYVKEGKDFYITRVEAKVSSYPGAYAGLAVEPGTKRYVGNVTWDSIVYIDNINSTELMLSGGNCNVGFSNMVVYYKEGTPPTAFAISEGNIWIAVAVGAAAVVAIAAVVIAKKKKKAE